MKTANWQSYYLQSPSLPTTFNKNSLHFPFHTVIGFLMKNEVCRNGLFFNQSLLIESKSFSPSKSSYIHHCVKKQDRRDIKSRHVSHIAIRAGEYYCYTIRKSLIQFDIKGIQTEPVKPLTAMYEICAPKPIQKTTTTKP